MSESKTDQRGPIEPNPAPITIALTAAAVEERSEGHAKLLHSAADVIEKLRAEREFYDRTSRRYHRALGRIAEFVVDMDSEVAADIRQMCEEGFRVP